MTMSFWSQSVSILPGVGPVLAKKLERCGLYQIVDLLFYLPYRYQDRTHLTSIDQLHHGEMAVIEGEIIAVEERKHRRPYLSITLSENGRHLDLRFFRYAFVMKKNLIRGLRLRCFGEAHLYQRQWTMIHPEWQVVSDDEPIELSETLTPLYPSTAGLSQTVLRKLIDKVVDYVGEHPVPDYLQQMTYVDKPLLSLCEAIRLVHRPNQDAKLLFNQINPAALSRLSFEELVAQQLALLQLRKQQLIEKAPCLSKDFQDRNLFLSQLPYQLTRAQNKVIQEISDDLSLSIPMMRLVQGDVGSGKTVVAAMALLQAMAAGYQCALMAPTEVLAQQHYQQLTAWFGQLGYHIGFLSGHQKTAARREMLAKIQSGAVHCVVGTHALFQASVEFHRLGFIVIDEQHRFGVAQRLLLREKGVQGDKVPHQLIMTATPIPRTLVMTAYAHLAVSIIDELPPGRLPIKTIAIMNEKRSEVIDRIRKKVNQRMQVYWVCTLITESESLQCQTAEETTLLLKAALPDVRIGLVHGQLSSVEKEACLQQFYRHDIDLLVATTVIEVGVNVPNANLMIIENAERLGLSQLHQLRGRVGRGNAESFCVLLYQSPLSHNAKQRLQLLRETQDGFMIAEKDLMMRGPGEILGHQQSGFAKLKIADLIRDAALIPQAKVIAEQLMQHHDDMIDPLIARWLNHKEKLAMS